MAICLIKKGGGGIQSEDTTAVRADVLAGKTALTADSNDEPISGTMPLLDRNGFDVTNMRLAHQRTDEKGQGYAVDSPTHGRGIALSVKPPDGKKYALDNNVELVFKPEPDLRAENIRGDKNIAGVQGGIPIWDVTAAGYSDMIYAWGDQGHAIDHPVAGRGLVVRIPNGYLIKGANWAFLKEAALLPWNIRQGTTILGIQGTLPDHSAGRVVFNGATFDGDLVSGVANKPFYIINDYYANYVSDGYRYSGIWGGGMNFSLTTFSPALLGIKIGCVLSQSINLSPFSRIAINYNLSGTVKNNPNINLECFVSPLRSLKRGGLVVQGVGNIDGFSEAKAVVRAGSIAINRQGQLTLDVRNINEQAFLSLTASITVANSRESFSGALQITKIEFIN